MDVRERVAAAAGIALSPGEQRALRSPGPAALRQAIAGVAPSLAEPERRRFLGLAGAALLALATGAAAPLASARPSPRPDRPGVSPVRNADTGARPDRPPEREPEISVALKAVKIYRGKHPMEVVRTFASRLTGVITRCLREHLRRGDRLAEKLVVTFIVMPKGDVLSFRVREYSGSYALETCLRPKVEKLRFPPSTGSEPTNVGVTYGITVRPAR